MLPVHFELFEGPLDLLLSLITKKEIDIYDIPIAEITEEYMGYLYTAGELNIELASEFIVVASQLIEIKTKMMLPKSDAEDGEGEDPRLALAERLEQYRIFKTISSYIGRREPYFGVMIGRDSEYFPSIKDEYAPVDSSMLVDALKAILVRFDAQNAEASVYEVIGDELAVSDAIGIIKDRLGREKIVSFFSLFSGRPSRGRIISMFLAVLEMLKENMIALAQSGNYGDITITGCD
ncbi:MAG: segregation/condensation protein A [Eubacteriales bacterium]|nr:segregation/condensation protein A [Eubacteriales bacterium]